MPLVEYAATAKLDPCETRYANSISPASLWLSVSAKRAPGADKMRYWPAANIGTFIKSSRLYSFCMWGKLIHNEEQPRVYCAAAAA